MIIIKYSYPPGTRAAGAHWLGEWLGPKAGLGAVDEETFCRIWESRTQFTHGHFSYPAE
jgi:hypothetical protein